MKTNPIPAGVFLRYRFQPHVIVQSDGKPGETPDLTFSGQVVSSNSIMHKIGMWDNCWIRSEWTVIMPPVERTIELLRAVETTGQTTSAYCLALANKYGLDMFKPFPVATCVVYDEYDEMETYMGELSTPGRGIVLFTGHNAGKFLVTTAPEGDGTLRFLPITPKEEFEWVGRSITPQDDTSPTKSTAGAAMILYFDRDRDTYRYVAIRGEQERKIRAFLGKWMTI